MNNEFDKNDNNSSIEDIPAEIEKKINAMICSLDELQAELEQIIKEIDEPYQQAKTVVSDDENADENYVEKEIINNSLSYFKNYCCVHEKTYQEIYDSNNEYLGVIELPYSPSIIPKPAKDTK